MDTVHIGWWNTSLSPPIKHAVSRNLKKISLAREVIHDVIVGAGVDVFALGEVAECDIRELLISDERSSKFGWEFDEVRHLLLVYNRSHIDARAVKTVKAVFKGRDLHAGIIVDFVIAGRPLLIVVAHWPSRVVGHHEGSRMACGTTLQGYFRKVREEDRHAPLVIIGDFNDEPFDYSLTTGLHGTRDRASARANEDLLYNPFWRLLGENQAGEPSGLARFAGSYYSTIDRSTCWYTFDQALVSSSLLQGNGWTLNERETTILSTDLLRTERGGFRYGFDHLPIVVRLDYCANNNEVLIE